MSNMAWKSIALVGVSLVIGACQDLNVVNTNEADRERALSEPGDVETLIAGSWQNLWGRLHSSTSSAYAFPTIADEMTATYANNASLELSSEPRPSYNNNPTSDASGLARFQWEDWYAALSNVNEGLAAIRDGLRLTTGESGEDNTERGRAFARLMQGVSLGYLGMLFDKAYIVDENSEIYRPPYNLPPYSPYPEVRDAAVAALEAAIEQMEANEFTLPESWINGLALTNEDLAKLAHSYIVRILVYTPRTPDERDAVDWDEVLFHIEKGITEDHAPILDPNVITSAYWLRVQSSSSFQARADYKLIGPSDVSGNYQEWLATPVPQRTKFLITTPDRRITGVDGPTSDGKYFRYLEREYFDASRGTYHFSWYQWYRNGGAYRFGLAVILSVDEMNLIKAEAYYRRGMLQEAADLINITRVANGELPPVTAAGVPQDAGCVPRTDDGECGKLLDALMYERMVELAGLDALRAYLDRRGFGTLIPGTFLHLPVPGRELESTGQELYTFGGGGEGSAP